MIEKNRETVLGVTASELALTIKRISQALPTGKLADVVNEIVDVFICEVLATNRSTNTISELNEAIREIFKIKYEDEEIEEAIGRLIESNTISLKGGEYQLGIGSQNLILSKIKDEMDGESRVYENWKADIAARYPSLTESDVDEIAGDLAIFLTRVLEQHGAETALLINPSASLPLSKNLVSDMNSFLPKRSPEISLIREKEFTNFFTEGDIARNRYIAKLLDASFIIHALTIDKTASELIKWHTKGTVVYIDTNFIYQLIDLHGERETAAAQQLMKFAKDMGMIMAVSSRTINELQASLKLARNHLKKYQIPPKRLAELAAREATQQNFVTAYWRLYAKESISIDEFFVRFRNVDVIMKDLGVEIRETLCTELETDAEVSGEAYRLGKFLRGKREDIVVRHDAFHRVLVKRLRGKVVHHFNEAKYWFLTCDMALTRYDQQINPDPGVPVCVSANQWMQLLRTIVPRTDDFSQAFEALLCSPYLRSQERLPVNTAQKIIDRMARTKRHDPEVAARLFTDEVFTAKIENAETEQIDEEFEIEAQHKEKEISDEKKAMQERQSGLEKEATKLAEKIKELETSVESNKGEAKKTIESLAKDRDQKSRESEALKKIMDTTEEALSESETEIGELQKTVSSYRSIAVWGVGIVCVIVIALLFYFIKMSTLVRVEVAFGGLVVYLAATAFFHGRETAKNHTVVVGVFLGILVAIFEIMETVYSNG